MFDNRSVLRYDTEGSSGQLGNGSTANSRFPVEVTGLTGVAVVEAGYMHTVARKGDGTVWTWGDNVCGELGNNGGICSAVPIAVSGLSGVIAIAAGDEHRVALKSDGAIRTWGANQYGQLGDSTAAAHYVPAQVPGLSGVSAVAAHGWHTAGTRLAHGWHTVARKSDGTMWAWGYNFYGQLGVGTTTNRPVTVLVRDDLKLW